MMAPLLREQNKERYKLREDTLPTLYKSVEIGRGGDNLRSSDTVKRFEMFSLNSSMLFCLQSVSILTILFPLWFIIII